MSKRGDKTVVALAGEDSNDRQCLRLVLEELCPELKGRFVMVNRPVRLRDAKNTLTERVGVLYRHAKAVAERSKAKLACLVVCEDFDAPEGPEARAAQKRVERALVQKAGNAHYLLAVYELEAWLLLFPQVLNKFCSTWEVPQKYHGRDTGTLTDPKRVLIREVSRPNRRYHESDAPEIVGQIVTGGHLYKHTGSNISWEHFHAEITACRRDHLHH